MRITTECCFGVHDGGSALKGRLIWCFVARHSCTHNTLHAVNMCVCVENSNVRIEVNLNVSTLFKNRPSLLSSEASQNSYRGLVNLAILLLVRRLNAHACISRLILLLSHTFFVQQVITNLRLVVVNLVRYGILLDFSILYRIEWYRWPGLLIGLGMRNTSMCTYLSDMSVCL